MPNAPRQPLVYVETTVPSYLTAWPSRDLLRASHQQITNEWWRDASGRYRLVISEAVVEECARGDPEAARSRLDAIRSIPVIARSPEAISLAAEYVRLLSLPPKALTDAMHVAYASVARVDYLATWNMRHLASSLTMRRLTTFNVDRGLHVPLIVTPEYLNLLDRPDEPSETERP